MATQHFELPGQFRTAHALDQAELHTTCYMIFMQKPPPFLFKAKLIQ
jgi:hypothetical protein